MVDAARLSTAQLDRISGSVLGTALINISDASTPTRQAADMVAYAETYGLMNELAAALLYTGADRPGLQNLLLGDGMSTDPQEFNVKNPDFFRLEMRVGRLEDKHEGLAAMVAEIRRDADYRQHLPLNWNIILAGFMLSVMVGVLIWTMATVR